ncbi:MAG: 5'-methylthioadenosine/adenosylhomocysteine nucleosidase [Elusimicrobiaceae bacterium]|nr:5'-methylthioadenosine/adenosylhomocysteine nucleosidase [Elusimicrobiaceae bacterium]
MRKIGLICALQRELSQILSHLEVKGTRSYGPFTFHIGVLNGCEVILSQSGMGKVNAAINALELIKNFEPDCLLNSGVAGGLDSQLNPLDTVAGSRYVYHDVWCGDGNEYGQVQDLPTFFSADNTLLSAVEKLHFQTPRAVHMGLICTGDQFVSGAEPVAKILKNFPQALACDMESAAIAQVCYRYHVPFLSMRLISDVAGKEETNSEQYKNFWSEMADVGFKRMWQLLGVLTGDVSHG